MFTKEDLAHANNLVLAIKKGEFKLDGMEILALSDAMRWLSRVVKVIEADLQEQQKPPVAIEPSKSPVVVQPEKGSKKNK